MRMEKKRKREKGPPNGAEGENGGSPSQKPIENDPKLSSNKQPVSSTANNTLPGGLSYNTQPFHPACPWQFPLQHHVSNTSQTQPQQTQQQQQQQQQQQASQPQAPLQTQAPQPEQPAGGQPQPTQTPAQPGQHQVPYWPSYAEYAAGRHHFMPFPPGHADANWSGSGFGGSQPANGNGTPFGYATSFPHPPAGGQSGYPGPWDPNAWYAQQQAAFAAGYVPPYAGYYGYAAPGCVTGIGPHPMHKGTIKLPPGLSQKHQQLWEVQSMENIHIWAALARAEAEISFLRSKVMQLDGEVQATKSHPDLGLEVAAAAQPAKRNRSRKSNAAGANPNEPTVPKPRGRRPASEKNLLCEKKDKVDIDKKVELLTSPVAAKPDITTNSSIAIDVNNSSVDDKVKCRTVGGAETAANVPPFLNNGIHDKLDFGSSKLGAQLTQAPDKNVDGLGKTPRSPIFDGDRLRAMKENCTETDRMGKIAGFAPGKLNGLKGPELYGGARAMASGETWAVASGANPCKNNTFEGRGFPNSSGIDAGKASSLNIDKVLPGWQHTSEDVSDEQQDEEDDADDEDDSVLEEMNASKLVNLNPAAGISNGISQINRW